MARGHSIHLDLLDFLALGILVPWALAWAKETFRYVGHCGLVFDNFVFLDRGILGTGIWYLINGSFEVLVFDTLVYGI